MPFLRLTRDRRGYENTFLMHADRPGDRPRLLYWYRTAPGIVLGRPALDEDAIRTIEEQHPEIDFDWPAILALSEVMTPEEEEPVRPPKKKKPQEQQQGRRKPQNAALVEGATPNEPTPQPDTPQLVEESASTPEAEDDEGTEAAAPAHHHVSGLLEELVGREIATRLRARYSEIQARIHEQRVDVGRRDAWLKRAEALNPEMWITPESILEGVRNADRLFDELRSEIHSSRE